MAAPLCDEPGPLSFTVYAGKTFTRRWTPTGTPWDLTGFEGRAMARLDYPAADPILTFDTADGSMTLGGTAGWFQLDLDDATTSAAGEAVGHRKVNLVFDLELVDGDGVVSQIARGVVTLKPEATRPVTP